MDVFGDNSCSSPCNTLGFLQKNNSLDDKGRISGQKNLLSCNNGDRDSRFRLTETDFSNLFARGEKLLHCEVEDDFLSFFWAKFSLFKLKMKYKCL